MLIISLKISFIAFFCAFVNSNFNLFLNGVNKFLLISYLIPFCLITFFCLAFVRTICNNKNSCNAKDCLASSASCNEFGKCIVLIALDMEGKFVLYFTLFEIISGYILAISFKINFKAKEIFFCVIPVVKS